MSATEFLTKIISKTVSNKRCVYFIADDSSIRFNIEKILLNSMYSIVVITLNNFLQYNQTSFCHEYILVSRNLERVENLFDKKNFPQYPFEVYKRILIFFEGYAGLTKDTIILDSVYMKANDVLMVHGVEEVFQEIGNNFQVFYFNLLI